MKHLEKRSSIISSIVTGLVGWIGFLIVGALAFGIDISVYTLIFSGTGLAIVQVAVLRLFFTSFQMHKKIMIGAFWGLVTTIPLYYALAYFVPEFATDSFKWLIVFAYIGGPIGAFLSYFYIDDRKVQSEFKISEPANYGRDAHWLEPFMYGVICYLIAFFPFTKIDFVIQVSIVGAVSGVFAAGVSHFSPDRFKFLVVSFTLIVLVMGTLQGLLTGLLFRNHGADVFFTPLQHGAIGGVLTYFITFLRGKQLAKKEMEAAV